MVCPCARVLSHFSRVWLFETLWTVACQAPLSIGFSRQEYWSGLQCPSSGDLPNPGIEFWSPVLLVDSLPSEPPGKSKNTGVGRLSLFQGNFLTQELKWGFLNCRWILYQLSYQGSPQGECMWVQQMTQNYYAILFSLKCTQKTRGKKKNI